MKTYARIPIIRGFKTSLLIGDETSIPISTVPVNRKMGFALKQKRPDRLEWVSITLIRWYFFAYFIRLFAKSFAQSKNRIQSFKKYII